VRRQKANVIEYFSYLLRLSRLFPVLNTANWFTGWPIRKPWQITVHQGVEKKRFLFAEILSMHASDPSPSNDHQTNFDLWQSSSFDYCCQGKAEKSWSQGVCVENIFIFHSNSMLIYLHNKPHFLPSLAARSSIIYQGTGDRCPFFCLSWAVRLEVPVPGIINTHRVHYFYRTSVWYFLLSLVYITPANTRRTLSSEPYFKRANLRINSVQLCVYVI